MPIFSPDGVVDKQNLLGRRCLSRNGFHWDDNDGRLQGVGGLDDPDPSLAASFPRPGLLLLLLLQMWEGAMPVLWQVGKSSFTGFDNNVIITELLGNILVVRHQHQLKVEQVEEIGQRCRRAQKGML